MKKTFYFYTIHSFLKEFYSDEFLSKYNKACKDYIKKPNSLLSNAILNGKEIKNNILKDEEKYILANGHDVRRLSINGIKEISEDSYNRILKDEEKIISNMSDREKDLLLNFGFDIGWHIPFKVEAKRRGYLKKALERKFGYSPNIIK